MAASFSFVCDLEAAATVRWSFRGVNPTISGKVFGWEEFKSSRWWKGETRDKISKIMFM